MFGLGNFTALLLLSGLGSASAFAAEPVSPLEAETQTYTACVGCDLKTFQLETTRLEIPLADGTSYGTRMTARYETRTTQQLEDYGVAQFIQGCEYSSRKVGGKIVRSRDVELPWRGGETIPFLFSQFTIDGPSADPLDWGDETSRGSRHFNYLWNSVAGSTRAKTSHLFGDRAPRNPSLYVEDMPGTAFFDRESGEAHNISLRFHTCLYHAAEVPLSVAPTQVSFAKPIQCFDWASSWVYDHDAGKMTSPRDLVDFCR